MKYRRDQNIKFTNNFPISKSNYDGMSNFQYARNLVEHRERSGTMHAIGHNDLNMFNSPKSFDGQQFPDIEKDMYLESLSNGDLSRVDATSMQRSFTNLQH